MIGDFSHFCGAFPPRSISWDGSGLASNSNGTETNARCIPLSTFTRGSGWILVSFWARLPMTCSGRLSKSSDHARFCVVFV